MFLDCTGSISWWIALLGQDQFEIQLRHSFQKQTSLSQFNIVGPNGKNKLSIPTIKSSRRGAYSDVLISNQEPWQVKHWRSIEAAYLKSPFFLYYNYKIEPVFKGSYLCLLDFNWAMLEAIIDCLKIEGMLIRDNIQDCSYTEINCAEQHAYPQVFDNKLGFIKDLSVLDLLFNLGPEAKTYLQNHSVSVR